MLIPLIHNLILFSGEMLEQLHFFQSQSSAGKQQFSILMETVLHVLALDATQPHNTRIGGRKALVFIVQLH